MKVGLIQVEAVRWDLSASMEDCDAYVEMTPEERATLVKVTDLNDGVQDWVERKVQDSKIP